VGVEATTYPAAEHFGTSIHDTMSNHVYKMLNLIIIMMMDGRGGVLVSDSRLLIVFGLANGYIEY
jgi:hypothetical protein